MRTRIVLLVATLAAALAPAAVRAQAASGEARLREALRTTTAQLHALEEERAAAQGREVELRAQVEKLRAELASARRPAPSPAPGASPARLADLERQLAQQVEDRGTAERTLGECRAAAGASAEVARAQGDERGKLTAQVVDLTERLARSEARNARMYQVGKSILDWLDRLGMGAALAAREPFLGLERVELENIAQDFEDKLLEQKGTP